MLIVTFVNDGTGTKETGNYDWKVHVNRRLIAKGRIENYQRINGWQGLVKTLVREARERGA